MLGSLSSASSSAAFHVSIPLAGLRSVLQLQEVLSRFAGGPFPLLSRFLRISCASRCVVQQRHWRWRPSGWSLSAQLLGFFLIFLNRSLSLLKASLPLLQTRGLSCFQILTSLWSHPTENTDLTDVQTSDCYSRQGFSVTKYIPSKRSAFLEDKLWGQKGWTSCFVLMVSTSSGMNENPWAVWSEPSKQQPLGSLAKHLPAGASFLHHNVVASGLWNLDESYHLFCITWGLSWVFQEAVAWVQADATIAVRMVTGKERWWWRSPGPWGLRRGPWSPPPVLRQDSGPRKGHSGSPVLVLSAAFPSVRTHLFKSVTTSGHPLSKCSQVPRTRCWLLLPWPLTGFQNFSAETIRHDSFLPEFCHQRTNSGNESFLFNVFAALKF